MKAGKVCYGIMLTLLLGSCKFNCSVGGDKTAKTKAVSSSDNIPLNGAVIKNDIELEATGVKFKEAYLMDADNNLLTSNTASVGEKIYLVLKTDTGWVKQNGLSFIGASERITTSAGKVVVDAVDIFKEYDTAGLPADEAGAVTLSALITQADPGIEDFVVQFRIWDKKGTGEIKGRYKFSIKK